MYWPGHMDTTYIALIALTAIYVPLFFYIRFKSSRNPNLKRFTTYGPAIMIKTRIGIKLINRLGKYKKIWRIFGVVSRLVTILLMLYIVVIIVIDLLMLPSIFDKDGIGIKYALPIPGINPVLPLAYGWIALIITLVFHEIAHGFQSKANDIDIDSTGLLHAVVPIGAFVEPNEEQIKKASRKSRMDIYSAGITANFIIAMISFALMFATISSVDSNYGDNPAICGYAPNSPIDDIPITAIITKLDDKEIANLDDFYKKVESSTSAEHRLECIHKGKPIKVEGVKLGVFINAVVQNSPASSASLKPGDLIISIDNKTINSPRQFTGAMKNIDPNKEIQIKFFDSSEKKVCEKCITLGEKNGRGYLGVITTLSGMNIVTPNIVMNNGINPYYGKNTVSEYVNGTLKYMANAFEGFSPIPESTHWWYHSTIMSDDIVWVIVQLLYWVFWLNLVVGVTNALPALPFDGGFLFMGGVDYIAERLVNSKKKELVVNFASSAVTYFMITALVLVTVVVIF